MMAFLSHFRSSLLVIFVSFVAICYGQIDAKGFTRNPNALIAYIVLGVVLGIFALTFSVITCYICYATRPRRQGWRPQRPSPTQGRKSESRGWERDVEKSREPDQERPARQERTRDRTQEYDGNFFMGPDGGGNYYKFQHNKPTKEDKVFIIQ